MTDEAAIQVALRRARSRLGAVRFITVSAGGFAIYSVGSSRDADQGYRVTVDQSESYRCTCPSELRPACWHRAAVWLARVQRMAGGLDPSGPRVGETAAVPPGQDELARRLLRYLGHDVAVAGLRDRCRYGHVLSDRERSLVERALAGTDVGQMSTFAADEAGVEMGSEMRIGQAESVEIWEEGTYDAKVAAVEETESTWPGKEGTPRLKFVFRVRSEDGSEYTDVWKYTNASLSKHKNATLRPLVAVLMPEADLDDPAFVLETDELVNERCRVILGVDQEKGRNTIDKVMRPAARSARPAAERAEPVAATAPRRAAAAVAVEEAAEIPF